MSDPRDTIKNQERTIASLRADLVSRGQAIEKLTAKNKELTERVADLQVLLEHEQSEHAGAVNSLEEMKAAHEAAMADGERLAELQVLLEHEQRERAVALAALEEMKTAHEEEVAFVERAQQDITDAAQRRLRDSERMLAAQRETFAADSEAHGLEVAELREALAALARDRDAAIRERDEARSQVEASAMDVARVQMDAHAREQRIAELEAAASTSTEAELRVLETELEAARARLADMARALEAAERDAVQQQLARDAAFHEMSVRAAEDLTRAVESTRAEAAAEREALERNHEQALKQARDKAIAQALAVARERKKQTGHME